VAHIHTGATGVSGPPNVAGLEAGGTTYAAANPTTLTAQNVTDITAGNTYFNVHSTAYPGGEIRGQIAVQTQQAP
jgi:CHRD domain